MNQDKLKRLEGRLNLWKAQSRQVTTSDLTSLAESEGVALPIVEAIWIKVTSRKIHDVRIEVPLVLKETQEGRLSTMTLQLLEPQTTSRLSGKWVCTPDALGEFKVFDGFVQSLENARSAVNALDNTHPIWPEDSPLVVQWEFTSPPCQGIDGGSAGCIIALGLIDLFRGADLINPEHRLSRTMNTRSAFPFTHLTASAQIDASGYLLPVEPEGLAAKEKAAGMNAMTHLILSRQQMRTVRTVSASTRKDMTCSNLNEALLNISALLGLETGLRAVYPRRWLKLVLAIALCAIVLFGIGWAVLAFPKFEWLVRWPELPRSVSVDFVKKPDDSDFGVHFDTTTDYMWVTRIWPALEKVRSSFALSIGGTTHFPDMRDRVSLAAFGELQGLRSLSLDHSEVAVLQGAENLKNLETFVDLGARVADLRWIEDIPLLRTVVLDSGFVEHYPKAFPETLETLILHVPPSETQEGINIKGKGDKLKRLALRGDGLKAIGWSTLFEFGGLASLTSLKEVILHLEEITEEEFKFQRDNHIETLELARCKNLRYFSLDHFPNLRKLRLLGTRFDHLIVSSVNDCLEELEIVEDAHLASLDFSNLKKLKKFVIKHTHIEQFLGLKEARHLTEIEIVGIDGDLNGVLKELPPIKSLKLTDCPGLTQLDLSAFPSLESLEITDTGLAKLNGLQWAKNLRSLIIRNAPLAETHDLGALMRLELLDLSKTKVRALENLTRLTQLADINISGTEITVFPVLGNHRTVTINMDGTPFQNSKKGSPFYEWRPSSKSVKENLLVHESSQDYRGGFGGDSSFQVDYYTATPIYSYYTYTPVSTYSTFYTPTFQSTGGPEKMIDIDGWEAEPETVPAPPLFDVRSIIEKWGINSKVSVGSWSYAIDHTDKAEMVAPFVNPKKVKKADPKVSP